jgi:hypothetical protein
MAKEEIQIKIDAAVQSAEAAKSLGQLRKSLIEIQTLQAEIGDTSGAQFDKLSQASASASAKLAETRDRIGDIQDKTRTLEGTPIERLSGSFGLLKESILNLDFDKAKIGAEGLLNTFTPVVDGKLVTGLAGVKGAFGMLADGVKSLGSTFMTVGKALLTNPIFLLAAAIIAIVAVVVLIMDKLGILKKIMDALGYAIGLVVKAFEALTDWLGLTTHAQEEAAAAAKKNGEEQRKQIDATATAQKNLAKLTEGLTQAEVDALRKKAGIKDELNKNSYDIEKTRLIQTQATLANEINALEELKAAGGDLTEEQQKDLEQRKTDYAANAQAIKDIEYQKIAYIQKLNQNLTQQLESWKIKNMANDVERAKAQAQMDKDAEIRKMDAIIREATLLGDTSAVKKANEIKKQIEIGFQNDIAKIQKDANDKQHTEAVNAQKKTSDKKAAAAAKGITDLEEALDHELELIRKQVLNKSITEEQGDDKILQKKREHLTKVYDYRMAHLKELNLKDKQVKDLKLVEENNLTEETIALQKKRTAAYYEEQKIVINNKEKEAEEQYKIAVGLARDENEITDAQNARDYEVFQTRLARINLQGKIDIEAANGNAEKIKEIRYRLAEEIAILETSDNEEWLAREAQKSATKLSALQYDYENEVSSKEKTRLKLDELNKAEETALFEARNAELAALDLTETEKADIKERYRQLDLERIKTAKEREMELNMRAWKNGVELAQKGAQAAQGISDALFAWKQRKAGDDLVKQKKNAEDQFKVNKALQVGTAVITGIQSVMSAFANGMKNPIPLLGPATAGVYAAIAGITSAANIAKIMATKFDASSFSPATDTGGTPASPATGDAAAVSNFQPNQFFGLGQQTAVGMPGGPKPIKVYVTETDIRDVSDRVSVIEQRAIY